MAKKKKDNTLLYGIGVLILIVVLIVIIRSFSGGEDTTPVQQTTPTTPTTEQPSEQQMLPEDVIEKADCNEDATIGFVKCESLADGNADLTIRNSGRADLEGVFYFMYDADKNELGEDSDIGSIAVGEDMTYTLKIADYEQLEMVKVVPIQNIGGVDTACANKILALRPAQNCK